MTIATVVTLLGVVAVFIDRFTAVDVVATPGAPPTRAESVPAITPQAIAARARLATLQIRALDAHGEAFAAGSGFFVSTDGRFATNLHVIRGAAALQIEMAGGGVYDNVSLITADARRDLAILQVPVEHTRPLPLATDTIDVGATVYAMGNPLGQVATFSSGLVSGQRTLDGVVLVQITAPISPGSSGGPVLNSRGDVIGISTLALREGQNLNYAVPVRYLRPLAASEEPATRFGATELPTSSGGLGTLEHADRSTRVSAAHAIPRPAETDRSRTEFTEFDSLARSAGWTPVGAIVRSQLGARSNASHSVTLVRGRRYMFVGQCDALCTDLDLHLLSPNGTMVSADTDPDAMPVVRYTPPADATYSLSVQMMSCAATMCVYALRMYGF